MGQGYEQAKQQASTPPVVSAPAPSAVSNAAAAADLPAVSVEPELGPTLAAAGPAVAAPPKPPGFVEGQRKNNAIQSTVAAPRAPGVVKLVSSPDGGKSGISGDNVVTTTATGHGLARSRTDVATSNLTADNKLGLSVTSGRAQSSGIAYTDAAFGDRTVAARSVEEKSERGVLVNANGAALTTRSSTETSTVAGTTRTNRTDGLERGVGLDASGVNASFRATQDDKVNKTGGSVSALSGLRHGDHGLEASVGAAATAKYGVGNAGISGTGTVGDGKVAIAGSVNAGLDTRNLSLPEDTPAFGGTFDFKPTFGTSFTARARMADPADPYGLWEITTEVKSTLGAEGSVGGSAFVFQASVRGSLSAGQARTYVTLRPYAEVRGFLTDLQAAERAEPGAGKPTEFRAIYAATAGMARAGESDRQSIASLRPGESMTGSDTLAGDIGGTVGVSAGIGASVGGKVGAARSVTKSAKVHAMQGETYYELSASVADSRSSGWSASATADVVTGTRTETDTATGTSGVTVWVHQSLRDRWLPQFDAIQTTADLARFQQDVTHVGLPTSSDEATATRNQVDHDATMLGIKVGGDSHVTERKSARSVGRDGALTRKESVTEADTFRLVGQSATKSSQVAASGSSTDAGVFVGRDLREESNVPGLNTNLVPALISRISARAAGVTLDGYDLLVIRQRAARAKAWDDCAHRNFGARSAWNAARTRVLRAPDAEGVAAALLQFAESAGAEEASEILLAVSSERYGDALTEGLGAREEWPPSISPLRTDYLMIRTVAASPRAAMLPQARMIAVIAAALDTATDFTDPGVHVQMWHEAQGWLDAVKVEREAAVFQDTLPDEIDVGLRELHWLKDREQRALKRLEAARPQTREILGDAMNPRGLVDELESVWPAMARLLRSLHAAKVAGAGGLVVDRSRAWEDGMFPDVELALRLLDDKFKAFDRSYAAGRRAVWAPYQVAAIKGDSR